jgi:hypothetical protein
VESRLSQHGSPIWAKIEDAWILAENLLKEMVDLETVIVLIIGLDGKVQKFWFEKKSGIPLYDQSATRAIKRLSPHPLSLKNWMKTRLRSESISSRTERG